MIRKIFRTPGYLSFSAYVFLLALVTMECPSLMGLVETRVLRLTDSQAAWMGNLMMLGAVAGYLLAGRAISRFGTKSSFVVCLRRGYRTDAVTDDDWRDIRRIYYAMCTKIGFLLGQVVDALVHRGIYDDTLLVFLSDHGDFAGDYNLPEKTHASLQDALLRVPLLIKPHGGVAGQPGIRHHLSELVDMTATIYDLLEIEPHYSSYGRSLRASLAGCDEEIRPAVFAEVGARKGEAAFKNLDVNKMDPESFYGVQSCCSLPAHDVGSYAVCCRTRTHKYIRRGYVDHHELYDLRDDPGEIVSEYTAWRRQG